MNKDQQGRLITFGFMALFVVVTALLPAVCRGQDREVRDLYHTRFGVYEPITQPAALSDGRARLFFKTGGFYVMYSDGTTRNLDSVGAGGSGTPGGSSTQIQFNDGGSFGGDADWTWDKTNNVAYLNGLLRFGYQSTIGTPAASSGYLYFKTDGWAYAKNAAGREFKWGQPYGSSQQIQYHGGGDTTSAEAEFTYNPTTNTIKVDSAYLANGINALRFAMRSEMSLLDIAGTGYLKWLERNTSTSEATLNLSRLKRYDISATGSGNYARRQGPSAFKHTYTVTVPDTLPQATGKAYVEIVNDAGAASYSESIPFSGSLTANMPVVAKTQDSTYVPSALYSIIEIPAGAINPGAGDLTGCTALANDADNSNDVTIDQLEFSATAENYCTFTVSMPADWDGSTVPKFKLVWYSGTGSANTVNWEMTLHWVRPGTDSWKAAYGSSTSITQAPTTADIWYITSAIDPGTTGTAAAGGQAVVRLMRDGDDGTNDTHTATARLVKVLMQYKRTSMGATSSW